METLKELEQYLIDECFNLCNISVNRVNRGDDQIVLDEENGRFCYCYYERGIKNIIESFATEKELVEYALKEFEREPQFFKAHTVAWTRSKEKLLQAVKELRECGIKFYGYDDSIHGGESTVYSVWVMGKDVLRLEKFWKKYWDKEFYRFFPEDSPLHY